MPFQSIKHPDFNIAFLICAAILSTLALFLFCFFGKLSTDIFYNMTDCLYESKWNELPIELQKFYVIIIGVGQRSHFYHGFGMIYLKLETFTRVSKYKIQSDHCSLTRHYVFNTFFFFRR